MQQRTRCILLNMNLVSQRLQCAWRVDDGRWLLQEKAFSGLLWEAIWTPGADGVGSPTKFPHQFRGFVFEIIQGLKYFHLAEWEEPFVHFRRFLFKRCFCQSVNWLLHWVSLFLLFYFINSCLCWPEFAEKWGAGGSMLRAGCSVSPPPKFASRFEAQAGRWLRVSGRKWFYRSELLQGWWPAASVWSLSFGACEDLWIALPSAETRCWVAVQLTLLDV